MAFASWKPAAVGFFSLLLIGCNGEDTLVTSEAPQRSSSIVIGQIVDIATLQPLPQATVSMIIDEEVLTAASGSGLEAGQFRFDSIPSGEHVFKVSATGYADIEQVIYVEPYGLIQTNYYFYYSGTDLQANLGKIGLAKTTTMTVRTLFAGSSIPGVSVSVEPDVFSGNCNAGLVNNTFLGKKQTVVSDSDGVAVFTGLSRCTLYKLYTAPLDHDQDGIYDYGTYVYSTLQNQNRIDPTFTPTLAATLPAWVSQVDLSLTHLSINRHLWTVNLQEPGLENDEYNVLSLDEIITATFNTYATPISEIQITDLNTHLPELAGEGVPTDSGATVAFLYDGTMMRITPPPGGYTPNHLYGLQGVFQASGFGSNGSSLDLSEYANTDTRTLYVPRPGAPQLEAVVRNSYQSFILAFSEIVRGSLHIRNLTTNQMISPVAIGDYTSSELIGRDEINCQSCSDTLYIAHIVDYYSGINPGDSLSVTVDLTDLDGNFLSSTVALTAQ